MQWSGTAITTILPWGERTGVCLGGCHRRRIRTRNRLRPRLRFGLGLEPRVELRLETRLDTSVVVRLEPSNARSHYGSVSASDESRNELWPEMRLRLWFPAKLLTRFQTRLVARIQHSFELRVFRCQEPVSS
jgi:hypothetical protein